MTTAGYATTPDGPRLYYRTYGAAGPWVVLIMGLGASSAMWFDVPERLAESEGSYRVLTVDLLGTGASDPLHRPTTLRAMAGHVVCAMNAAGIERATVVGISMGGMVAQHVALDHGARLEGLVLMATTPGLLHGSPPTLRAIRSLVRVGFARWEQADVAEKLVRDLILPRSQRYRAREILDRLRQAFNQAPTRNDVFFWHLLASSLHSTGRSLDRISVPTVVVTGDDDTIMGRRSSHVLASRIPNAVLEVIPSCGHGISFTHPDAVAKAIARLRAL